LLEQAGPGHVPGGDLLIERAQHAVLESLRKCLHSRAGRVENCRSDARQVADHALDRAREPLSNAERAEDLKAPVRTVVATAAAAVPAAADTPMLLINPAAKPENAP